MAERALRERPVVGRAVAAVAEVLDRLPSHRPSLAVLTYHRVAPPGSRPDLHAGLCIAPDAFADQARLLAARAEPVGIDDVLAAADGRAALPPRAVLVTFDDAYADIEEHAWPVLRELGIPAVMFVPTAHPDGGLTFWWDELSNAVHRTPGADLRVGVTRWPTGSDGQRDRTFAALRAQVASMPHADARALVADVVAAAHEQGAPPSRPATSSWDGLRAMAAEGMALGAHTRHHPFLDRLTPAEVIAEVAGSMADLRERVGGAARPVFAYPSGAHDASVVDAVGGLGVRLAFTTDRGVVDLHEPDWLRVPRINVGRRADAALVHLQLDPRFHAARRLGARLRHRTRPDPRRRPNGVQPWS